MTSGHCDAYRKKMPDRTSNEVKEFDFDVVSNTRPVTPQDVTDIYGLRRRSDEFLERSLKRVPWRTGKTIPAVENVLEFVI